MPVCIAEEPNNERQIGIVLKKKMKEEGANHEPLEDLMSQQQTIRIALINKESQNYKNIMFSKCFFFFYFVNAFICDMIKVGF